MLWLCVSFYFSHWVGIGITSIFGLLIFLGALLRKILTGRLKWDTLFLLAFVAGYGALVVYLQRPTLQESSAWSPSSTLRMLLLALGPFLIFALVSLLPPLAKDQVDRFFRVSYYLLAGTILVEWLLVNVAGVSNTLMPGFRDSPAYYERYAGPFYRPFWLTGNSAVNGSLLAVATWLLIFASGVRHPARYVLATGIILALNYSGQALLTYALLVTYYLYHGGRGSLMKLLILPFVAVTAYVVQSGIIYKISLDYVLNLLQYVGIKTFLAMDATGRIMGGYGRYSQLFEDPLFVTEFYPIFAISRFGVLLVLVTWCYIFARLPRYRRLVDCAINSMSNSGALSARALLCG